MDVTLSLVLGVIAALAFPKLRFFSWWATVGIAAFLAMIAWTLYTTFSVPATLAFLLPALFAVCQVEIERRKRVEVLKRRDLQYNLSNASLLIPRASHESGVPSWPRGLSVDVYWDSTGGLWIRPNSLPIPLVPIPALLIASVTVGQSKTDPQGAVSTELVLSVGGPGQQYDIVLLLPGDWNTVNGERSTLVNHIARSLGTSVPRPNNAP